MLSLCWRYFSLLGASWALLGLSRALLGCLLAFLAVFFAFESAPGSILKGFGAFRESFWSLQPLFFERFERMWACFSHKLQICKNLGKTQVFVMFYAHDARCEQEQNDKKSFLRQVELRFPRRSCAKLGLGLAGLYFGGVWDALGHSLGVTWPALGRSWAALDPSWTLLGCLLDASWALLDVSWLI